MRIRTGYEIVHRCPRPTPMVPLLSPYPSRTVDLLSSHRMQLDRTVAGPAYTDGFGNHRTRMAAPAGQLTIPARFVVRDDGLAEVAAPEARQHPVEDLPDDVLTCLLDGRYRDTDQLSGIARSRLGQGPTGWRWVQAVRDHAHDRIVLNYQHASATRAAADAHRERRRVCRDYAHPVITDELPLRRRPARAPDRMSIMPPKKRILSSFVTFDILYEDGSKSSNRRVPAAELVGLDGDGPAKAILEAQDREIGVASGRPRGPIKRLIRSPS